MKRRTVLQMVASAPVLARAVDSSFAAVTQGRREMPRGIFVGTHYEYPFGGNSWRTEWRPKSYEDWRKDLTAIRQTGFNLIRIRIGFDSKLDDTEVLLNMAHELGLKVDYGFATFYAPDWFTQKYPEARMVNGNGETLGAPRDRRWPRA